MKSVYVKTLVQMHTRLNLPMISNENFTIYNTFMAISGLIGYLTKRK